jgi:hypothetical protein
LTEVTELVIKLVLLVVFTATPQRAPWIRLSKFYAIDLEYERTGNKANLNLVFLCLCGLVKSRDNSVGIALGYGLDNRGSRVRFLAGAGNFSLHHRVQTGSGAHPAPYPMGTRGCFSGDKAARAQS